MCICRRTCRADAPPYASTAQPARAVARRRRDYLPPERGLCRVRTCYELALASLGAHGAREYVHRTTPSGAASSRRRHGAVLAAAGTEDRAL